ncbi:phosphoglycerate mutase 1-like isoform X2 [Macrosteles quadrilineatus]|nr:phosphoglycerate mutase 1-like isoform X2 [Macrosteles quadrilineatus]XP_054263070.1 phosphoglycerate mutase 1-like isoform X2 [Macrosteles quadrilineatus]XP_054263078.1 phosphoglycerate mutase 1-like isoform X2 [Macrosteles quadrilineatus]XP_054263087.1 phosphoglycerate mutase 1-like isoform X2 [Macrosteles quadrilineatus]XP_054263095.1 phosphoglycerate mutase 1-like isoform X2 [Macrosteles quadrilineatus]XP_054263103.1 phosphoglycerate mutase 1-like isoform X2 [Macrosteles quadrilineatus]
MVQRGKFKVVFVRHGESEWTKHNLFCGWYDAPLSNKGLEEAVSSGKALRDAGLEFDVAFTSLLTRANQTLDIIKTEIDQLDLPVVEHWRLNERHYGDLTGYNKEEMAEKYGLEQVQIWRRKFDVLPPPMKETHKYYTSIVENPKFKSQPNIFIPEVESLETTMVRTLPLWNETIVPDILSGKRVLIVTHGTTLRGLVKHIDGISNEDIMKLNLPTGMPFYYELDENLKPVVSMKFFSNREAVEKAMALVASISHRN